MSADNWTYCPKCRELEAAANVARELELETQYGKISAERYLAMVENVRIAAEKPLEVTLREDFEVGIHGTSFDVSYTSCCTRCGFNYEFNHSVEIDIVSEKPKKKTRR